MSDDLARFLIAFRRAIQSGDSEEPLTRYTLNRIVETAVLETIDGQSVWHTELLSPAEPRP